jgi:hypothetical protein
MSKARDLAGIFNLGPRSGTTAQRPATAEVGDIYYNGTTGKTEIYTTTGWKEMASGIPFGNTASRPTAVTGQPYFNGETARLEMYTSASGWQNIVQEVPGVASITGTYSEAANSGTITIAGTNFVSGAIASAIGTNGVEVLASSTTFNSLVQVVAVFTGLSNANEPYDIKVTNPSNLFGLIPDALYVNASPVWQTAAGSFGTFSELISVSVSATATDSDSTIAYTLASGSTLPTGVTLNSSTGVISGALPDIVTNTTYSFTINASDGLHVIPRTFSFTSNAAPVWTTAAGTLGSFNELSNLNVSVAATDTGESVSYSLAEGSSLPSGVSLNSSTGAITGTVPSNASNTTYTFTINVSDGISTVARQFSFTSLILLNGSTTQRAAPSPKYLKSIGVNTSGNYWFKNAGYNSGTPFAAYADMSVGDGYIITSGIQLSGGAQTTTYSEFGTAATTASGSIAYNSNFHLPTANILTSWTGDTNNRFIVGMTDRSGTSINSATGKHWFALNLPLATVKTWFDNTPGVGEFSGNVVVASSSGTIPNSGATYWTTGHGNGVIQFTSSGSSTVNNQLWMELRDSNNDSNHSAIVWGDGAGQYYTGNPPFTTRWMFMGFSPGNMS